MKSLCVPPPGVPRVWPLVSHWVKAAMARGDLNSFAEIEADVLSGRALLWLVHDAARTVAAVVTQISAAEHTKVCTILACGGDGAKDWKHLLSDVEDYARIEGCSVMRIFGRRGWARVLPDYSATKIILEKRI